MTPTLILPVAFWWLCCWYQWIRHKTVAAGFYINAVQYTNGNQIRHTSLVGAPCRGYMVYPFRHSLYRSPSSTSSVSLKCFKTTVILLNLYFFPQHPLSPCQELSTTQITPGHQGSSGVSFPLFDGGWGAVTDSIRSASVTSNLSSECLIATREWKLAWMVSLVRLTVIQKALYKADSCWYLPLGSQQVLPLCTSLQLYFNCNCI